MYRKNWLALVGFVALCEGAGVIGSLFTAPASGGWYAVLAKPNIAPPNWVFAPVWTTLFALMGVAAFLVWRKRKTVGSKSASGLFVLQLALNVLWSIVFFGLHNPGGALAEIICLWLAIAATIAAFAQISKSAAWLMAPYLAWVSFAAYLNYLLWVLNR